MLSLIVSMAFQASAGLKPIWSILDTRSNIHRQCPSAFYLAQGWYSLVLLDSDWNRRCCYWCRSSLHVVIVSPLISLLYWVQLGLFDRSQFRPVAMAFRFGFPLFREEYVGLNECNFPIRQCAEWSLLIPSRVVLQSVISLVLDCDTAIMSIICFDPFWLKDWKVMWLSCWNHVFMMRRPMPW